MAELWTAPRLLQGWEDVRRSFMQLEDLLRRLTGWYIPVRRVSADTLLLGTDRLLIVDTTNDPVTVSLPPAATVASQPYAIKLIAGTDNVTLAADGSEEIHTTSGAGTLVWNTTGATKTIVPCLVSAPATWGWIEINT